MAGLALGQNRVLPCRPDNPVGNMANCGWCRGFAGVRQMERERCRDPAKNTPETCNCLSTQSTSGWALRVGCGPPGASIGILRRQRPSRRTIVYSVTIGLGFGALWHA